MSRDRAVETCITFYAYRPGIRRRLAALVGTMRAQSLEPSTGSNTSVFCWFHGDEVARCHHLGRCSVHRRECVCKPKLPCQGEPVLSATDMAGESGIGHDVYRRLLEDVDRAELLLSRAVGTRRPATHYVAEAGRWRLRVKFGRYRFGLHRINGWSSFSWGAGIATGNVMRRG